MYFKKLKKNEYYKELLQSLLKKYRPLYFYPNRCKDEEVLFRLWQSWDKTCFERFLKEDDQEKLDRMAQLRIIRSKPLEEDNILFLFYHLIYIDFNLTPENKNFKSISAMALKEIEHFVGLKLKKENKKYMTGDFPQKS